MNITIVEVDGSLTNPLVLAAIGLWSAVLSFLAVLVARRTRGWLMRLSALIMLLALTAMTRFAQEAIGSPLHGLRQQWR
jgi:hypothetical protein